MEAHSNLKDAVIEAAHGRGGVTPQELERLVLFEELARVELLDAAQKRVRRRIGTARLSGLLRCAGRLPLRRAR